MTWMPRHVVAKAAEIPPRTRKLVAIGERQIVILNVKGELFALSDKCPHKGGSLSLGKLTGAVTSSGPGDYAYARPGEILRCPWHGWEFDVRTGRSWCDPQRMRLMNYAVSAEPGAKLVEGPRRSRSRWKTSTWWSKPSDRQACASPRPPQCARIFDRKSWARSLRGVPKNASLSVAASGRK